MSKGSDWAFAPRDEDAEEDPHTVMHVYEGDGGVIIRDGGNISTFGVQSRAVMAAFNAASEEPGPEHHVIADLAARLAEAERALEDAEKVIKPFAFEAADWDAIANGGFTFQDQLKIDGCTDLTVGHLRAASRWMESRPSPPKEG